MSKLREGWSGVPRLHYVEPRSVFISTRRRGGGHSLACTCRLSLCERRSYEVLERRHGARLGVLHPDWHPSAGEAPRTPAANVRGVEVYALSSTDMQLVVLQLCCLWWALASPHSSGEQHLLFPAEHGTFLAQTWGCIHSLRGRVSMLGVFLEQWCWTLSSATCGLYTILIACR